MNLTRERYDETYFQGLLHEQKPDSKRNENRLMEILEYADGGKLLEIGCGLGGFLQLAHSHFDVEGVDVNEYAVEQGKQTLGERVRLSNVELERLPPEEYHVIAAFNVLEHLKKPAKAVSNIFQSLRPGGILIGSVPYNAGIIGAFHTFLTNIFDRTHISTFGPHRWKRIFSRSGFTDVEFFGEINFGKNNSTYVYDSRWSPAWINLMFVGTKLTSD